MVTISKITPDAALKRLEEIKPYDWTKLDALAADLRRELGDGPRMLGRFWCARMGNERRAYERMLGQLAELSVSAWLSAADQSKGENRLDALRGACAAAESERNRVASRLSSVLLRKAAIPPAPLDGRAEEKDLPSRDCDEAYIALRRLLKSDESEHVNIVARRRLLHLTEEQRDGVVTEYLTDGRFTPIVEADQ